jgi:hypothetical protein
MADRKPEKVERKADDPFHVRAIEALRGNGAIIVEMDQEWFCEVHSTLKALWLRYSGEVKRRLEEHMEQYVCLSEADETYTFVSVQNFPNLLEQLDETEQSIVVQQVKKHRPSDEHYLRFVQWPALAIQLMVFSRHPVAIEWSSWFFGEFLPAIRRYGHYDPATNHEPPPSRLLDAIEWRERGRDLLNGSIS